MFSEFHVVILYEVFVSALKSSGNCVHCVTEHLKHCVMHTEHTYAFYSYVSPVRWPFNPLNKATRIYIDSLRNISCTVHLLASFDSYLQQRSFPWAVLLIVALHHGPRPLNSYVDFFPAGLRWISPTFIDQISRPKRLKLHLTTEELVGLQIRCYPQQSEFWLSRQTRRSNTSNVEHSTADCIMLFHHVFQFVTKIKSCCPNCYCELQLGGPN